MKLKIPKNCTKQVLMTKYAQTKIFKFSGTLQTRIMDKNHRIFVKVSKKQCYKYDIFRSL